MTKHIVKRCSVRGWGGARLPFAECLSGRGVSLESIGAVSNFLHFFRGWKTKELLTGDGPSLEILPLVVLTAWRRGDSLSLQERVI